MNLMDVQEVEPDEYTSRAYAYPVYVHLKGGDLYRHKQIILMIEMIFMPILKTIIVCLINI